VTVKELCRRPGESVNHEPGDEKLQLQCSPSTRGSKAGMALRGWRGSENSARCGVIGETLSGHFDVVDGGTGFGNGLAGEAHSFEVKFESFLEFLTRFFLTISDGGAAGDIGRI
jgi:hypothetical protein